MDDGEWLDRLSQQSLKKNVHHFFFQPSRCTSNIIYNQVAPQLRVTITFYKKRSFTQILSNSKPFLEKKKIKTKI